MPTLEQLQNLYLNQNLSAYHFDRQATKDKNLNETNPGIGIEHQNGDFRQMLGQYLNSKGRKSNYALVGYTPFNMQGSFGKLSAGIVGGGITGYTVPITPAVGLLGSYQNGRMGVNITAVPDATVNGQKAHGFLGAQLRYKLK